MISLLEKLVETNFADQFKSISDEDYKKRIDFDPDDLQAMKLLLNVKDVEQEAKLGGWDSIEGFEDELSLKAGWFVGKWTVSPESEDKPVGKLSRVHIEVFQYAGSRVWNEEMVGWKDDKGNVFVDVDTLG